MTISPLDPSRVRTLLLAACLGLLVAALPVAAQVDPADPVDPVQPAQFDESTTVLEVEVPVRVLVDGEPVRGLSAEDFRVFDGGEERELASFEVYDHEALSAGAGGAEEPPFAARRYFLLLFDLDFTDAHYLERSHRAAEELVEEGLRPGDMVAVAFFSQRAGVSSVLGFTPDQRQVRAAIDRLGTYLGEEGEEALAEAAAEGSEEERDILQLTAGDWEAVLADLGQARYRERSLADETMDFYGAPGGGRRGFDAAETVRDMAAYAVEDMRQKRAARAAAMTGSLRDLAESYRWVDGQKYLVLFSRGFESDLYTADGGSWLLSEVQAMIDGFRKAGWTLFSIEGADLNTPDNKRRREALLMMARETGGDLISGRNDFTQSIGRVLAQTDVTYLLTFRGPAVPEDGAFRQIEVELVESDRVPRGAEVSHRAGYYAPQPFQEMALAERRVATAELMLAGREVDELGVRALVSPAEVLTGNRMRVPVVLEVDALSLLASRNWQATRIEAMAYAFDPEGRIAGHWGRSFFLTPGVVMKASRAGALVFYGEVELSPGSYEMRSVVRNVDDGRVTLRKSEVRVPTLDAGKPALLHPIFAEMVDEGEEESANRILVRDVSGGTEYPFVFGERRFLPALDPAFVRGSETLLLGRGIGWEGEGAPGGLRAVVFDGDGFPVPGGVAVRLLEATPGDGDRVRQLALGFRPESLPPGEYELLLMVQGPDGETVSSPRVSFRVMEAAAGGV